MNSQSVVSIRLRPDEADLLRATAEREGSTVSEFIRGAAGREAILQRPGAQIVRLANGAPLAFWTNAPAIVLV